MSRIIVLDTGPIISLVMNDLLQFLEELRDRFEGEFVITPAVRRELIGRPLETKRFAFEALRVMKYIRKGTLTIMDYASLKAETERLMELANHTFQAKGQWIKIVHYAEIESIALALKEKAEAFVVDERTTRMLLENPEALEVRLSKKLHTHILVNRQNLAEFSRITKGLKVLRSVELMTAAYELGLLKEYLPENVPEGKPDQMLLSAMLWGLKFSGCAISNDELARVSKITRKPAQSL